MAHIHNRFVSLSEEPLPLPEEPLLPMLEEPPLPLLEEPLVLEELSSLELFGLFAGDSLLSGLPLLELSGLDGVSPTDALELFDEAGLSFIGELFGLFAGDSSLPELPLLALSGLDGVSPMEPGLSFFGELAGLSSLEEPPLLGELSGDPPLLGELSGDPPLLGELPGLSPSGELPGLSPLLEELPGLSPLLEELPGLSPLLGALTGLSPLLGELPGLSPLLGELPGLSDVGLSPLLSLSPLSPFVVGATPGLDLGADPEFVFKVSDPVQSAPEGFSVPSTTNMIVYIRRTEASMVPVSVTTSDPPGSRVCPATSATKSIDPAKLVVASRPVSVTVSARLVTGRRMVTVKAKSTLPVPMT
jgi:hypothetical protein